ncbi:hypothetical protein HYU14_00485 [Candidatus Woesearchaeota archaeon]|nr:hypothetical protein [Candidatus Woesearchaeota archaeon]
MLQQLKEDGKKIGLGFAAAAILLQAVFYRGSFFVIFKMSLSLFWLFVIPGFFLLYLFRKEMPFLERFVMGTILGMAFFGVIGYNLRIIGMAAIYQAWLLPILGIGIGAFALSRREKSAESPEKSNHHS